MKKGHIFLHPSNSEHYRAQAFAVRCFDDRFRTVFEKFMTDQRIEQYDSESPAGGAKIFSSPEQESDRDFIMRELEKSIQLHHTDTVILFTHHDCGAYGGLGRFDEGEEKEFAFHIAEHEKARRAIADRFPNLIVETYFIDPHGILKT